jgi:hypothetical protein
MVRDKRGEGEYVIENGTLIGRLAVRGILWRTLGTLHFKTGNQ